MNKNKKKWAGKMSVIAVWKCNLVISASVWFAFQIQGDIICTAYYFPVTIQLNKTRLLPSIQHETKPTGMNGLYQNKEGKLGEQEKNQQVQGNRNAFKK